MAMMIDPEDIERVRRSQRARASVLMGDHHQQQVGRALTFHGLLLVERIETGWKVRTINGRKIAMHPLGKVHADWTAVCPGGRSVRCEAKMRSDDQLSLSDFAPHQFHALTHHAHFGGLSLVGWVQSGGCSLLLWPIAGLEKGKPLNAGDDRYVAAMWRGVGHG